MLGRRLTSVTAATTVLAPQPLCSSYTTAAKSLSPEASANPQKVFELVSGLAQAQDSTARDFAAALTPEARVVLAKELFKAVANDNRSNDDRYGKGGRFEAVDIDNDGMITRQEFAVWKALHLPAVMKEADESSAKNAPRPTNTQLRQTFVKAMIPFIGFGFLDNSIMLVAGDVIDVQLGATLHLTTMAAAGLGNMVADVTGIGVTGYIESLTDKLGLADPELTNGQQGLRIVRLVRTAAHMSGIACGCFLGMSPLLFI